MSGLVHVHSRRLMPVRRMRNRRPARADVGRTTFSLVFALVCLSKPALAGESLSPAVRRALGQIETGARHHGHCAADRVRGKNREVSRYQILPGLWRTYAGRADYTNPAKAWSVTEQILTERKARFRRLTGRRAELFDLYVLWNAPGHYEQVGFHRGRVRSVIAARAERFSNLVSRFEPTEFRGMN